MLVQAGLCRTCSETTLLVFPRGGSILHELVFVIIGYKDIFETFDDNQDGCLCLEELEPVLQICGYNPTKEDKDKFMAEFDKDSKEIFS